MHVVKLLKDLVRTRSFSGEEGEFAGLLKEKLGEAGVDRVWIDKVGNVVAEVKGGGSAEVVLEGHMDTVGIGRPELWHVPPFSGREIDGYVYGRGASDMKGGIAAQIAAVENLGELDMDLHLIYTVMEEVAEGLAFKAALEAALKGVKPSAVITGEPTSLNVALGQKGRSVIRVEIKGVSAHAALPQEGESALEAFAKLVWRVKEETSAIHSQESLGGETSTPVSIRCSPEGMPQLPDLCVALFDHRSLPGRKKEEIIDLYTRSLDGLRKEYSRISYMVQFLEVELKSWRGVLLNGKAFFPGWLNTSRRLIKPVLENVKKAYSKVSRYYWAFSTDLVYPSGEIGIPGFGLGPGDEAQAHKPDERVSAMQLRKSVQEYIKIIEALNRALP